MFVDFIKSGFDTDYLFLPEGAWDTAKEVGSNLEAITQRQYQEGLVDQNEFQSRMQEISGTTTFDAAFKEPGNSPTGAFFGAIGEGLQKLPDNINRVLGGGINSIFRAIPWNLWLLIIVGLTLYVIFQLGLLKRLAVK